jgi:tRNA acetyltransferase TAN1
VFKEFNMLATTYRRLERAACSELRRLLIQVGDSDTVVSKSGVSGLIAAKTSLNPCTAVGKLREILRERPYEFRYLLRVMPIQKLVTTDMVDIESATKELGSEIGENETFRITIEKRFTELHTNEIIEKIAANIKRKVNLTKPDKILLIQIVGEVTGISVIGPNDVLSVLKEKVL